MFQRVAISVCLTTILLSAVACCGLLNPASRLYGKWKFDVEGTYAQHPADAAEVDELTILRAINTIFLTVEFRSDGTMEFKTNSIADTVPALTGMSGESTWSLASADGDTLTLDIGRSGASYTTQTQINMLISDSFAWIDSNRSQSLVFRRHVED